MRELKLKFNLLVFMSLLRIMDFMLYFKFLLNMFRFKLLGNFLWFMTGRFVLVEYKEEFEREFERVCIDWLIDCCWCLVDLRLLESFKFMLLTEFDKVRLLSRAFWVWCWWWSKFWLIKFFWLGWVVKDIIGSLRSITFRREFWADIAVLVWDIKGFDWVIMILLWLSEFEVSRFWSVWLL